MRQSRCSSSARLPASGRRSPPESQRQFAMTSEDRMHATELDQYWDALVLAQRPQGTQLLDGGTTDLIERMWVLAAPSNSVLARERVWRRLHQHPEWEERDINTGAHARDAIDAPFAAIHPVVTSRSRQLPSSGHAGWRSVT